MRSSTGLYWRFVGDSNAGSGRALPSGAGFSLDNTTVPVPVGSWFRLETFVHRSSGTDGRVWVKINGVTAFDRRGPNMGALNLPINRYFMTTVYTNGRTPAYQWTDDIEIYDGVPY